MIKRILNKPLEGNYLSAWRTFVKKLNQSDPLRREWDKICESEYGNTIALQRDCETRFTSSVVMLSQAVQVQNAGISSIHAHTDLFQSKKCGI